VSDEVIVSIIQLSLVMMLFRCAVNISSPFYSTYMIRDIQLDFSVYSILTAIPLLTKALCLTNWARLLDDNRKFEGLAIATVAIGAVPVLWAVNATAPWIGVLQVLSGLSWAGFDLISILLVQNMYPRSITQKLGIYLALSSVGSVAGGLLGGVILKLTESYHVLFAISCVLRLVTGFGLLWYLRRHHLFRFHQLRLKSGIATLMTVRPSLEAAAKILPLPFRNKDSRPNRAA
jgi:MFS family permease